MTAPGNANSQVSGQFVDDIIFLDTNCVHCAKLYLRWGKRSPASGMEIHSPKSDISTFEPRFETGNGATQDLMRGFLYIRYLKNKVQQNYQIVYSHVTFFEMNMGKLRSRAFLKAAESGVPGRWWTRVDDNEMLKHLVRDDFAKVCPAIDDVEELFQEMAMQLGLVGHVKEGPREAWELVRLLSECVFIDMPDALIYADAVACGATELLTHDRYLFNTVNWLDNPCSAPLGTRDVFCSAKKSLVELVASHRMVSPDDVILPQAKRARPGKRLVS